MSTRYARTADKAQNEKNSTILKNLLKQPGNKFCSDCRRKDPRWASWNLGIFVCIRCSGIHRSLGTHISKVKSVDLDSWIPSQIESMEKWGNERANLYWEANLKDSKPNESNMEMWIRSKYDMKRWAMKGPIPDPGTLNGGGSSVSSQQQTPSTAPKPKTSAPPKSTPKQSEFNSLDDFFGSSPSNSTTTSNMTNSNNNTQQQQFQGNDIFASMSDAAPEPAKEQPKPQIDFKSSIMSLYGKQPQAAASTPSSFMGNGNNNLNTGGNYQQQLLGLGGGFSSMSTTTQQTIGQDSNSNNGWGSFVSSAAPATNSFTSQVSNGQIFGGTSFQQQQQQQQQQQPKKQAYDAFADLLN